MDHVELGSLALSRGDCQEAINLFRRALDEKKEARAFFGFAMAHYQLGDLPTARWAFAKTLELDPAHKEAEGLLAKTAAKEERKSIGLRRSLFRAGKGYLEFRDKEWRPFFVKGINLGLGLPGFFPGEFPIKEGTYRKWFDQMAELGVNALRIYTIHPPEFYRALYQANKAGHRLFLLQGIWTELPGDGDFRAAPFLDGLHAEIRNAVDAVCGNVVLPERPGRAHGRYDCDVSPYTAAFIVGREWESCTVKAFNEMHGRQTADYQGDFLSMEGGAPFEVWIAEVCDYLQQYEHSRYRITHPVTTVNWPTLDPLTHPSESRYEDEYRLQGIASQSPHGGCIDVHIEDVESLDLAKMKAHKGAGFFALYHAYPYYPDFMNHDYEGEKDTYRAYLRALKRHHGTQPVLIAEFGVPASRESAHWHRDGWNHGGHSEERQGVINGLLMQAIHEEGMAGGALFSWFDEWFKKNWLFQPYELPAERKPLWFNLQDPEENYGLLAAYPSYPGRKVTLAGRDEEWREAQVFYRKTDGLPLFRFADGSDDARTLVELAARHDEGFLYLRLKTKGSIDFSRAHYLIGLDTSGAGIGERLFPCGTNLESPAGMSFVIHLAGKSASRILAARAYDKYTHEKTGSIRPAASNEGAWVMMQNRTNIRRISKDGTKFFPSSVSAMSGLTFGSLDADHRDYHSLADFFFSNDTIELRIPWGLLNFTDPSSKTVLWMDQEAETRKTKGVGVLACSYKPRERGFEAATTGRANNCTDVLPSGFEAGAVATYSWDNWETPVYHTYLKKSYYAFQKTLAQLPERP